MRSVKTNPPSHEQLGICPFARRGQRGNTPLPAPVGQHLFPPDVKTVGVVSISYLMPAADFVSATNAVRASGVSLKIASNVTVEKVVAPQERARLFEEAYLDPEIDLLWFSHGGNRGARCRELAGCSKITAFVVFLPPPCTPK